MLKLSIRLPAVFIGIALVTLAFPSAIAQTDLQGIANKITVKIISQIPLPTSPGSREKSVDMAGSGVIIAREKSTKTYYVLTVYHVAAGIAEDQDKVVTSDERKYVIKKVDQLRSDLDLAVLKFNTDKNYPVAELGDSDINYLRDGSKIYIAGWSKENPLLFQFEEGTVTGNILPAADEGYALRYDARTVNGMSGGPLINDRGHLVGVHGESDAFEQRGIPITTFLLTATPEIRQALGRPIAPTIPSPSVAINPIAEPLLPPSPPPQKPGTLPVLPQPSAGVTPSRIVPPTRPPVGGVRPQPTPTRLPVGGVRPQPTPTRPPVGGVRPQPTQSNRVATGRRTPAPPRLPICIPNRTPPRTAINPNLLAQIGVNQAIGGSLNPGDPTNSYTSGRFRDYQLVGVNPGQSLEINLDARFDSFLQILDASNGRILCENDGRRGGGQNSQQLILNVAQRMNYLIRVTTYEPNATGSYTLRTRIR